MEEERMTLTALRKAAELQGLHEVDDDSLHAIGRELEAFRSLLRKELPPAAFDDQPSDFRAAQLRAGDHV
jgi:hypothetical protein